MSGQRVDFTPGGKPVTHGGSGTAYANYGCRCDECTAANTRRVARRKTERGPEEAPTHGNASTYSNWGCRCEPCSAAHAEQMREGEASRKARKDQAPHGTVSAYMHWACRCDACNEVGRAYSRLRYAKRTAATS